ncbi:MAG: SoxR reducing system RseC family protein [Clostridia bacterium]|nr:SoxR reducing system RseC family protein [Clostridia bacterium]
MREEGVVKAENGELCEVVVRRKTACGDNCASCGGACKMNFQQVVAKNEIGAKAGDSVIIEMDSKKVIFSAFLVYIMPILVFVISFYGLAKINFEDTVKTALAGGLTVVAFCITVLYDRRHKSDFLPTVIKIEENA